VQNPLEVNHAGDLLAGLAMKGEADQDLSNLDNRSGRQFLKFVEIENDIFAQIPRFEAQLCRDGVRCDQRLPKWRAGNMARDSAMAA
jgi:hypothetical protein